MKSPRRAAHALIALPVLRAAGRPIELATFDTDADLMNAIKDGGVAFAVDEQTWLQGFQAVDTLSNFVFGGGEPILTGPSFIDKSNIEQISSYATEGIR